MPSPSASVTVKVSDVRRNAAPDERSEGMREKPSALSLVATMLAVALARPLATTKLLHTACAREE